MGKYIYTYSGGIYTYTYSGGIYTYTYSDGTVVEIPVLPKSLKQAITPQPKEDKEKWQE